MVGPVALIVMRAVGRRPPDASVLAANKFPVQYGPKQTILGLEHHFDYALQQRYIAVNADLQQAIRESGPSAQQMCRFLGMFESKQRDQKNEIGMLEIAKRDRTSSASGI
jgi:hypothetical protein